MPAIFIILALFGLMGGMMGGSGRSQTRESANDSDPDPTPPDIDPAVDEAEEDSAPDSTSSEPNISAEPEDETPAAQTPVVPAPAPIDGVQLRLGLANFLDGLGLIDLGAPNAREISNAVAQQTEDMPSSEGLSNMFWAWGQFIDHDIDLTPTGETEFIPIIVPGDDPVLTPGGIIPFNRAEPFEGTGVDGPREYSNEITALMDASMVYGSDEETTALLRDGAYLRMNGDALPENDAGQMIAGDVRVTENVVLTGLHTVFARNHNHWVDELRAENPMLSDDELFAEARLRVEGEIQAITYNDWLPLLLGPDILGDYEGFDPDVNPEVSLEFSTAAFRFGHTLLSASIERLEEDGSDIPSGPLMLREAFFNQDAIEAGGGIDPILRGVAASQAQELDTQVIEDVRSFLLGEDGSTGLDLAALNIMRGRDVGLEKYNDMRASLGLERAEDFSDITSDPVLAANLASVYDSPDEVDAWVGGLAEDPVEGGLLGELFSTVVADQFVRLRDGDLEWIGSDTSGLDPEEVAEIQDTSLADVILRVTDVEALQDAVFLSHARIGGDDLDNSLSAADGPALLVGLGGADTLTGGDEDDALFGGAGIDLLEGGGGNDQLVGGEGLDVFRFDVMSGEDSIGDFMAGESIEIDTGGETDPIYSLFLQDDASILVQIGEDFRLHVENAEADEVEDALSFF